MRNIFKFVSIVAAFLCMSLYASAQSVYETGNLFNNTSVSVTGGAMSWINPAVTGSENFFQGVRPSATISFQKYVTPTVGFQVYGQAAVNSLPFADGSPRWTFVDQSNVGANTLVNMNNLFHKYKGQPDRVEFVTFLGMGWLHGYTTQGSSPFTAWDRENNAENFLTANMGQQINFNMGKKRAWQITVIPGITYLLAGEGNPVQFNAQRAYVSLETGVNIKFGYKNSKKVKTHNFTAVPVPYYAQADIDALKARIEELENRKPTVVTETKYVEKVVPGETVTLEHHIMPKVQFLHNSDVLAETSLTTVKELAEVINGTDTDWELIGYASTEGTDEYNRELALRRAYALRDALVDAGVEAGRLIAIAGGATDQFGSDLELNRVVLVQPATE